ncbi:HEPN domain-containing protein [Herbidospora mongoliensis]|uniref:HEPN domain-containing protein n=1 Tax=Herbidospora mongoliensis TaxID=688067 RepID=UPI0012F7F4BB|nr:HEPN domain-containing protein [Herbidospora mongoliensis]
MLEPAIRHFGAALISYTLNIDETALQAMVAGEEDVAAESRDLLVLVTRRLEEERIRCAIADMPLSSALFSLAEEIPSGKRSVFNSWRLAAGGSLPDFRTGDPVVDAFAPIAMEMYPLCIAKRMEGHFGLIYLTHSFFDSTERPDFERAVLEDSALRRLVDVEEREGRRVKARVKVNTGQSSAIFMQELQNSILNSTYIYARMRSGLDVQGFKVALENTFATLRRAATGKLTQIPVWIGFNNIAVPGRVELPWGTVSPYGEPNGFEFVPGEARPSRGGEDSATLGFVLETKRDYQIEIDYDYQNESGEIQWPASMERAELAMQRSCERTQLAFTLGIDRTLPAACSRSWTLMADPLSMTTGLSSHMRAAMPVDFYVVNDTEIYSLEHWAGLIHTASSEKVEIALRRLISATTERRNAVDGFVDAVVAWENIFAGTSQGELSFRICAAMSKLLESDGEKRLALHKTLVAMYNSRSKVVHGAKELSHEEAVAARGYALDVLLRCLRMLYSDYPELLTDVDRSKRIILTL